MRYTRFFFGLGALLAAFSLSADDSLQIAFGSCLKQDQPQPFWRAVQRMRPDVFIFLGDNFYADTRDPQTLTRHYRDFAALPALRELREHAQVFATWDDHDYGENDAGADYPLRSLAQRLFNKTFPAKRQADRQGVYLSHVVSWQDRRIQIILLDSRSFRGPLKKSGLLGLCPYPPDSIEHNTTDKLLGETQWTWLEQQLRQPADLRLLVSSIQVLPDQHCWEKWSNFPHERERLLSLLKQLEIENLLILSGDRHFADLSRLPAERLGFPLYEVTASGLNSAGGRSAETNRFRVARKTFADNHFGLLRLSTTEQSIALDVQIRDDNGDLVFSHPLNFDTGRVPASVFGNSTTESMHSLPTPITP